MKTAKLFKNGRSQAIRLPKEYNFSGTEVYVQKVGESVIVFPKEKVWETFLHGLNGFSDDFLADGREQAVIQERAAMQERDYNVSD